MGAGLAATCKGERCWVPAGRSEATERRAENAGLNACESLEELSATCQMIVSICPPEAAEELAASVSEADFSGIYLDANALAPATARRIGEHFDRFVDGGIVGPPPTVAGTTRLYLSGAEAPTVARYWGESLVEVRVVDGGAGAASAVKTCFAAWTKGTSALLLAIRALAESEGVTEAIVDEWKTSMPDLVARSEYTASAIAPKAWRFSGEMEEIAAAFAAHELPSGFHTAAAELYRTLGEFKDRKPGPSLREVLRVLEARQR
jgi:3-hydroxyisobutyrate dehydrogenase-like beta-hydroxyacid dehydrogenase